MNRRHLRGQDGIAFLHLLRERNFLNRGGRDAFLRLLLRPGPDRCDQRTDPDPGRAQIADLVDLQTGIDPPAAGHDFLHLVRGHGVHAAAERVELDDVKVLMLLDVVRRGVEARVIHPLVVDAERPLQFAEMGDGVLGQHRHPVGIDHLRDSVVDLRVDMIGSSGENDAVASGLFQIAERLFALPFDVPACLRLLLPRGHCRVDHLDLRKVMENLHHAVAEDLLIGEGEEGIHETD